MILYPAIDILGGNAVRLEKGDFAAKKVYDQDPLSAAREWVSDGARWLHVVDLDGAKEGHPVNLEHLQRITNELDVPVQYGGGLRSLPAVRTMMPMPSGTSSSSISSLRRRRSAALVILRDTPPPRPA